MRSISTSRRIIALSAAAVVVGALAACSPTAEPSDTTAPVDISPELAALYEAAKEEGTVTVYMNVTPDVVEAVSQGFTAAYPGIEVAAVRLPDAEMIPRLDAELGSGAPTADLIENASPIWLATKGAEGAWVPADLSPQASGAGDYDASQWFDPATNVYEVGGSITTFAWNTELWPDGLEDYTDLTDAGLSEGKIGVIELSSAPSNDFYIWLEDTFGVDFYDDLGAQGPRIYPSTTGIVEALGAGEIYATNWMVPSVLEQAKAAGAPVEYAMRSGGSLFGLHGYAVVNAQAASPNAAQLFLDYMLTAEGQSLLWPTASSVLSPPPAGVLASNDELPPFNAEQSTPEKIADARVRWDAAFR